MLHCSRLEPEEIHTRLAPHIRTIPDYPKEGIQFKDITPALKNPEAFALLCEQLTLPFVDAQLKYIAGIESRGFIFGAPMARLLNIGFIPLRKAGKLPAETLSVEYALEYGTDTLEIHADALEKGDRVLLVDDLLATGGTAEAALKLLELCGADIVGAAFAIELNFLKGRERLKPCKTTSLIQY